MQFSKTLLALFATATALAGAYTFDDGDAFGDLEARDLHADEHYLAARSAAGDAAVDYLEARDAHRALQKRIGGNGECKAAGKSGKAHCMKNGRSCAAKGCKPGAKNGDYCLCDAGFKG